jgi:hypothetical protein
MTPDEDTKQLRSAFQDLLHDNERGVMVALTQHFDKVIELYANEHAVDGGSNNGRTPNGRNNSGDRSPNVGQLLHHSERNMDVTKRKKPVFLHSSTVGTKELDSLVEAASKGKQTKDD